MDLWIYIVMSMDHDLKKNSFECNHLKIPVAAGSIPGSVEYFFSVYSLKGSQK